MKDYREVLGTVEGLRRGFTSGTCAQAAAQGAAEFLVGGEERDSVDITLKGGMALRLPLSGQERGEGYAACSIIKDSGDDSDITHGKEFRATVSYIDREEILIKGGKGVGTVTKEGLPVSPGEPAINPNPLKMIRRSLEPLMTGGRGFEVVISVPEGEELARNTWNPRIGIEGGISIIGTSGIIEPKSSKAYRASIALCLNVVRKSHSPIAHVTPGYVGEAYLKKELHLDEENIVKIGDHVGYALDAAASRGFKEIHLVGHIGKMAKVAAGIFDTHCRYGDARLETIAAFAAAAGAGQREILEILDMTMAEAAVPYLKERDLMETFDLLNERLLQRIAVRLKKEIKLISTIVDLKGNVLSQKMGGKS